MRMKRPFSYEVVYGMTGPDECYIESGMSIAEDFVEAVNLLVQEFGTDLVSIKDITFFNLGTSLIKLPKSIIMSYEAGKYADTERMCDRCGREYTNNDDCQRG